MPAVALVTLKSQGISRHGIGPQSQNILSPALEELNFYDTLFIFLTANVGVFI